MTAIDASLPERAEVRASRRDRGGGAAIAAPKDRARSFRRARRHTWLVRSLRFTLPVAALASFAFYFTGIVVTIKAGPGELKVPLPTFDGENFRMENPRYEGQTQEGGRFVVTALFGYQDIRNPTTFRLNTIEGRLTQANGDVATIVSDTGLYDSKTEVLDLAGKIKVTTSSGMVAYLRTANVQVKPQLVTSHDPVTVTMESGSKVDADGMQLDAKAKEVSFEGNVRSHLTRPAATAGVPVGKER
jgi:hypothetical protein